MDPDADEELDDFDFKSMISSIDPLLQNNQSFYLNNNSDNNRSGFFPKPTASPQPSVLWTTSAQMPPHRLSRSNSGHVISSRLRCASDMHQLGYLNQEEKSYMKDLILSRNERFKEELALAERTSDWQKLSQYLRNAKLTDSNHSTTSVVDSLVSEFDTINSKKRMASNSFGRPKKSVVPLTPPPAPVVAVVAKEEADFAGLDEMATKQKKNERERKRRLAVSNGFDELFVLLKLPQSSKIDKVSILRKAIDRIQELEGIVRSNGMVVPPPNTFSVAAAATRYEEEDDE